MRKPTEKAISAATISTASFGQAARAQRSSIAPMASTSNAPTSSASRCLPEALFGRPDQQRDGDADEGAERDGEPAPARDVRASAHLAFVRPVDRTEREREPRRQRRRERCGQQRRGERDGHPEPAHGGPSAHRFVAARSRLRAVHHEAEHAPPVDHVEGSGDLRLGRRRRRAPRRSRRRKARSPSSRRAARASAADRGSRGRSGSRAPRAACACSPRPAAPTDSAGSTRTGSTSSWLPVDAQHGVLERRGAFEHLGEPAVHAQAERRGHRRLAQIAVHEHHAPAGLHRVHHGEADRSQRLAVARQRARDGERANRAAGRERIDARAQRAELLRHERTRAAAA